MARKGQFQPGQSGNPKGRPPKERALSDQLEAAGSKTYEFDGKRISGKRLIARLLWELAIHGRVELPDSVEEVEDGKPKLKPVTLRVTSTKEWLDSIKQIYSQVDGPPKGELDLNADGELRIILERRDKSIPADIDPEAD